MSQLKTNSIVDASGGNTATINGVAPNVSNIRGKNKIINGDMRIDQRGTSGSPISVSTDSGIYATDRWKVGANGGGVFSAQQTSTAPAGFSNSLLLTVTTIDSSIAAGDYYNVQQRIEGYNISEFNFGSSDASTITFSFWVRSSITGTYGGSLYNNAANRSYPFTYTVDASNTWEKKTVTVVGDVTGTWTTDNTAGLTLNFSLGSGTTYEGASGSWGGALYFGATGQTDWIANSGATFYLTGVQLEAGDTASGFETLSYGETLALCQRYYWRHAGTVYLNMSAKTSASTTAHTQVFPPVPFRSNTYSVGFGSFANVSGVTATQLDYTGFRINGTATSGSGTAAVITIAADAEL